MSAAKRDPLPSRDRGAKAPLPELEPAWAAHLVSVASDVALILDREGVIRRAAFGGSDPLADVDAEWVGRPWIDTVTSETREKVEQLLREVSESGVSRLRQVNHPSPTGPDIPVAYTAVRLERGHVLVIGRDMRAISTLQQRLVETQQAMERDYWRMRNVETRYRLLFQIASDAMLVVDATTLRIVDANAVAATLFDVAADRLIGKPLTIGVHPASHDAVDALLAAARTTGRAGEVRARRAVGGGDILISASFFRQDGSGLVLVRARPLSEGTAQAGVTAPLLSLVERSPDPIALTTPDGVIVAANPAFLELTQLASEEQAKETSLARWIGRPGSDVPMILGIVRSYGVARMLTTSSHGEHGHSTEIEISAVAIQDSGEEYVGFVMRDIGRRASLAQVGARNLTKAVEELTSLVGRQSLPDLVRDTTDLVERHFIEAALQLTGGNRTAAAEVLGLSRQSLYMKLRRHNLGGDSDSEETSATR